MNKFLLKPVLLFFCYISSALAYDQTLEASAPGEWFVGPPRLNFNARCNGVCVVGQSKVVAEIQVPQGWEIEGRNDLSPIAGQADCYIESGVFKAGSSIKIFSTASYASSQVDAGTFRCSRLFGLRRVSNNAEVTIKARRASDSGNIAFVRAWMMGLTGDAFNGNTDNLTGAWTVMGNLSGVATRSVPSRIAIQYNSKIDLSPGETKNMFEVSDAYGSYTVSVNLNGDASSDLTLVHSSGATGNYVCNGSLQKGNVCKIKANSQINWYGQKQAIANITLSII